MSCHFLLPTPQPKVPAQMEQVRIQVFCAQRPYCRQFHCCQMSNV
jgi:hypothetical protein